MITLTVNGASHDLDADPDMPLLWAILKVRRDHLKASN
jgi:aerobic-type carbon monoxide dehydrogenase small subunit (CoxS/CutS family)